MLFSLPARHLLFRRRSRFHSRQGGSSVTRYLLLRWGLREVGRSGGALLDVAAGEGGEAEFAASSVTASVTAAKGNSIMAEKSP